MRMCRDEYSESLKESLPENEKGLADAYNNWLGAEKAGAEEIFCRQAFIDAVQMLWE